MGLSPTRYFTVHYVLVLYSLYVPALPGIIILYTVCACTI